jgi:hypothetical protein
VIILQIQYMSDMSNSEKNDNGSACERRAGVAIYIAAASMSIVLAAALGVGLMVAGRIKMLNEAGDSVKAFSLAQIGVEDALFKQIDSAGSSYSWTDGDSRYEVTSYVCGEFVCIQSTGKYRNANRAIRIRM